MKSFINFAFKVACDVKGKGWGQGRGIHVPWQKHRGPSQPPMCALAFPSVLAFKVLRIFSSSPRSAGMTDTNMSGFHTGSGIMASALLPESSFQQDVMFYYS